MRQDRRRRSLYDNDKIINVYNYLKQYEEEPYDFFSIPSDATIANDLGYKKWVSQYAINRLIKLQIIEKRKPISQQSDKDCPSIYRIIRFVKGE